MKTAALVLAAGGSRRLGRPKQLLDWNDTTLLGHVLDGVRAWPVDGVWIVLGASGDEIRQRVDLTAVEVVDNPDWHTGLASSLAAGLAALDDGDFEAAFIVIGDQPDLAPEVPAALLRAAAASAAPALLPVYRGVRSNPALVRRELWSALRRLEGDGGARRLWRDHPEWVEEVAFDLEPPSDVDTAEDVARLRPGGQTSSP